MSTTLTIQNTYYDALFFASAPINEKQSFHLMPSELRLLQKLIHYSTTQTNITWSSENISKHIFTSVTSIDKSIQRLKQKGYINVSTTQRFEKVKSRTIFVNWEKIEMVNQLANDYLNEVGAAPEVIKEATPEASIQPEETKFDYCDEEPKIEFNYSDKVSEKINNLKNIINDSENLMKSDVSFKVISIFKDFSSYETDNITKEIYCNYRKIKSGEFNLDNYLSEKLNQKELV
jgi:biotin operon repressor